jgi:hypothetical protein
MRSTVVITGSRSWNNREPILQALCSLPKDTLVVHGGASGADSMAGEVAEGFGLEVAVIKADWKKHGKRAGPIRNIEMLETFKPNKVIAFWDGESRGTRHTIDEAYLRKIEVEIWR